MTDTVVIVDDSPAILSLLQDILRSEGLGMPCQYYTDRV